MWCHCVSILSFSACTDSAFELSMIVSRNIFLYLISLVTIFSHSGDICHSVIFLFSLCVYSALNFFITTLMCTMESFPSWHSTGTHSSSSSLEDSFENPGSIKKSDVVRSPSITLSSVCTTLIFCVLVVYTL